MEIESMEQFMNSNIVIDGEFLISIFTMIMVIIFAVVLTIYLISDHKKTKIADMRNSMYKNAQKNQKTEVMTVYTDKSKNYSGTDILPIPEKQPTNDYSYEFVGWDKNHFNEAGDTVAEAVFIKKMNEIVNNNCVNEETIFETKYEFDEKPIENLENLESVEEQKNYLEAIDNDFSKNEKIELDEKKLSDYNSYDTERVFDEFTEAQVDVFIPDDKDEIKDNSDAEPIENVENIEKTEFVEPACNMSFGNYYVDVETKNNQDVSPTQYFGNLQNCKRTSKNIDKKSIKLEKNSETENPEKISGKSEKNFTMNNVFAVSGIINNSNKIDENNVSDSLNISDEKQLNDNIISEPKQEIVESEPKLEIIQEIQYEVPTKTEKRKTKTSEEKDATIEKKKPITKKKDGATIEMNENPKPTRRKSETSAGSTKKKTEKTSNSAEDDLKSKTISKSGVMYQNNFDIDTINKQESETSKKKKTVVSKDTQKNSEEEDDFIIPKISVLATQKRSETARKNGKPADGAKAEKLSEFDAITIDKTQRVPKTKQASSVSQEDETINTPVLVNRRRKTMK